MKEGVSMRIALVDDNHTQVTELFDMLHTELALAGCPDCKIDIFQSGEAFLLNWRAGDYDIIILDIFMDRISGIDAARRIRESDAAARLVICSTSNEFASESYEVNAQYYLLKPVTAESVASMFQRLNIEALENTRTVTLPDGHPIMLRRILYTDYYNHVITFTLKEAESYRLRISQAELEAFLLPFEYFFSPVKGIILNFYEVAKMTEDSFLMNDGKAIHITRRKYRDAKEAYMRFRFKKMRKEVEG